MQVDLVNNKCEVICVDVMEDNSMTAVRIATVYSPGTEGAAQNMVSMEILTEQLEALCSVDHPVLFVGDLNAPHIDWKERKCASVATPREKHLLEFCVLNSLSQLVDAPTRPASGNLLDLVLCSDDLICESDIAVVPCPVSSDHLSIKLSLPLTVNEKLLDEGLDFVNADYDSILASLLSTDWNAMFADTVSIDGMYNGFIDYLYCIVEANVLRRACRPTGALPSYIERMHQRLDRCDPSDISLMERLQSELTKAHIRQRCQIEQSVAESGNSARFFGYASSRLKLKNDLAVLVSAGTKITDDRQKSDLLCDLFESTYLNSGIASCLSSVFCPTEFQQVTDVDVSERTVFEVLKNLDPKLSLSPELLPAIFFKKAALGLAYPLSLIFRRSLEESHIPSLYRNAWIAPVHKGGSKTDPANKRPVSLTAVTCKVLERIISSAILSNAEQQGLISNTQFAYRKGRSTTDCLLMFFSDVGRWISENRPVDIIYCDFKSAFETMPHDLLISILPSKGVGPKIVQWISDFLRNRTFKVKVGGALSREGSVGTGCPQGTVLGSMLFMLFIDQVKHIIPSSVKYVIYADDIKLYMPIEDGNDATILQNVMNDFVVWSKKMGLKLSAHKCGVLHLGSRNRQHDYMLDGLMLSKMETVKDLGVRFSATLNFKEQVTYIADKCSMLCNWILRAFVVRSACVYIKLYKSHVVPLLLYGCQVWNPPRMSDINLLEKMQRRFLRRVELRCNIERHSVHLMSVKELFDVADIRQLTKIMNNDEMFDVLFEIQSTTSRTGFVIRPPIQTTNAKVAHLYPWRVVSKINDG